MYSLVKFDNNEYCVLLSKNVKIIQDKECLVKYKNGAKYVGLLIDTDESEDLLKETQKKLENTLINEESQHIQDINESINACSTPINGDTRKLHDACVEISSITDNTQNASESSPPTGATDILNIVGDDWMDNSIQSTENVHNDQDADDNLNNICELENHNDYVDSSKKTSDSDDLRKDSNYSISNITDNKSNEISQSCTEENLSTDVASFENVPPVDVRNIRVPNSKNSSSRKPIKKYFCPYCKKLQTKFARHLELKHKKENAVQTFVHLRKGTSERAKIIARIRNEGALLHNTNAEYNTGILLTTRRCQRGHTKTTEDYICCTNCKGFYSKRTIRIHYSRCKATHKKGVREITVMGRRITGYIHDRANTVLRRIVFPVLRDDTVTRCIKYDELLILFGNKLCDKYTLAHQHEMIRAHLRLLGRFKLAIQEINKEIDEFAKIFKPQNFDSAVDALRVVAHWDASIMWFKTPAVATTLSTLLRKCAHTLKSEFIKKQDFARKQAVDDFLVLWEEDVPNIMKRAIEDQEKKKRQKTKVLPSMQDIRLLYNHLKKKINDCQEILKNKFDLCAWKTLTESTLLLVQIFNRRRAGEIERLMIVDYKNQETIDKSVNSDIYENLSESSKEYARRFVRITIRGKLGRTVPVLLHSTVVQSIDVILKYRKRAGVKSDNEYVFSTVGRSKIQKKYLRACPLMRTYSEECGATLPSSLRGTTLRKQIATFTAMLGIEDAQVDTLANFMGHHKDIHKNIYRVSGPVVEMTELTRLLAAAIGKDTTKNKCEDNNNSNVEHPNTIAENVAETNSSTSNPDNNYANIIAEKEINVSVGRVTDDLGMQKRSDDTEKSSKNEKINKRVTNIPTGLKSPNISRKNSDHIKNNSNERKRRVCFINTSSDSEDRDILQKKTKRIKECTKENETDDYFTNSSSDSESSNISGKKKKYLKKHARSEDDILRFRHNPSVSAREKIKRHRWSDEEKRAVVKYFGKISTLSKLPSLQECCNAIKLHKALRNRTPEQLKTWIDNQRRAKSRNTAF